jgi:DNA-binding NarL/FixJ family response regulator
MADHASAPDAIRVVIVDDHAFVRRGVRAYVDTVPTFEMIGEAGDGEQLLALLHQWRTTHRPLPHVVLMDLEMPGMGGVGTIATVARTHPEVKVVVLTSFGQVERVHAALAAGAAGYLLKDADPEEVGTAVREAAAGGVHLGSSVARQLGTDRAGAGDPHPGRRGPLQPRHRRAARHQRAHGPHARQQHAEQAAAVVAHPGGAAGHPRRAHHPSVVTTRGSVRARRMT